MADIKFSQFTAEADLSNFTSIVGYDGVGPANLRITPTELVASLEGLLFDTSPLPVNKGGTGETTFTAGFLKVAASWIPELELPKIKLQFLSNVLYSN